MIYNENNEKYEIIETNMVEYKAKKRFPFKKAAASFISLGLVFGAGYAGASLAINNIEIPAPIQITEIHEVPIVPLAATNTSVSLTELFEFANPSVVAISTETLGMNFFGQTVTRPSSGSGFIISEDGFIVTNYHVIQNANTISVIMYDEEIYNAVVVGQNPSYDLAVLKILTDRDLDALSFARSYPQVGEQVVAIGNPLGEFQNSMSVGHVSANNRTITIDGITFDAIQTDAAVNRGNSGGPLLNTMGEVVGVVTAKSGGSGVEGLGFAIPSKTVDSIVSSIIEGGVSIAKRAVLGIVVNGDTLTIDYISEGSAAHLADMQIDDRILAVNETHVFNHESLRAYLDELAPGDVVRVTILRNSQIIIKDVILGGAF